MWVYFRGSIMPFIGDKLVLGRYLGSSIDVGTALIENILKSNVQVVYRPKYCGLTI